MLETDRVTQIKGVGEKKESLLHRLGVYCVGDMLRFFPRDYVLYPAPVPIREARVDALCAVQVRVTKRPVSRRGRSMTVTVGAFFDEADGERLDALWFRSPYIAGKFHTGDTLILYGKIADKDGKKTLSMPAVFDLYEYKKIEGKPRPVYPLTAGLSNNALTSAIDYALKNTSFEPDVTPPDAAARLMLCPHEAALRGIHFPRDFEELKESRRRLVFEEFYTFLSKLRELRKKENIPDNLFAFGERDFVEALTARLPFTLTNAQQRTLDTVISDLDGEKITYRLIQGDVGSGKTIVALLAMLYVTEAGYQAAIMAPTSVLATQHYESFCSQIAALGLHREVVLLTGKSKERARVKKRIASDPGLIIVGTHALISEDVQFYHLGLVVTDEQHRFGVRQRDALALKGETPHQLVMSATPIPRSLALILYGDMAVSVMDELPQERLPIKSFVATEEYRNSAYRFIEGQIGEGHQAYVICPLVEPSEELEGHDVETEADAFAKRFSHCRIGKLNGRMKAEEKDRVMEQFAAGEIDILVSTTVIEVGINVPNATFMLIEDAERFGLASLHQLRGRVGRGAAQSYCVFMNGSESEAAAERLKIMGESNDGFAIADYDLKMRGPGDFFGIRQSGELGFHLADIYQDAEMLHAAAEAVESEAGA